MLEIYAEIGEEHGWKYLDVCVMSNGAKSCETGDRQIQTTRSTSPSAIIGLMLQKQ